MGSIFSTAEVPTPTLPSTYRNELTGTEQVPVTNADGSITYITREIELTGEQKAKQEKLESIAKNSLEEIENLSSSDYTFSEDTQKLLDDWEYEQQQSSDSSFTERSRQEEDVLASRGISDSTAADTVRRQRKQDQYDADKEIDREKTTLGNSIRATELQNQYNLYNLAQDQENYDLATKQSSVSNALSQMNAINATTNSSINDYYTTKLANSRSTASQLIGAGSTLAMALL